MSYDLSQLNKKQLAVVQDEDKVKGALFVTAGAGSGKTRVLTHRIAYLIKEKGVSGFNILAITFTNKTANEMKERVRDMGVNTSGVWISTFHGMCVRFLRKFGKKLDYDENFSIYGENEKEREIKRILKEKDNEIDKEEIKDIIFHIGKAKSEGYSAEEYYKENLHVEGIEQVRDVYIAYEENLKKSNALDFDDLLNKAYLLLSTYDEVREYYANRFHYIHVDEFQDTNLIQYKLVKILSSIHGNVLLVGDENQMIYSWRGACVDNVKSFIQDPNLNAKTYQLDQNYRSTKKILEQANEFAKNTPTPSGVQVKLYTENPEGSDVRYMSSPSESDEAFFVLKKMKELMNEYNLNYNDFAVLVRLNSLTRPFEEKFIQYAIPHKIFGGFKFYERKEIKDVLAYLRCLVNPNDEDAVLRIINFPKRGIGDVSVRQLRNYSHIENKSLFNIICDIEENEDLPTSLIKKLSNLSQIFKCLIEEKDLKPYHLTRYLVKLLDLKNVFTDSIEDESRKKNIGELINSMKDFEKSNENAGINEYLQNVSLYSDTEEMNGQDCVNIATIHSAKGLEFKAVFVVGFEDGIFPYEKRLIEKSELEEERRLMYVAMTRAKEHLFLTGSDSRFLYGVRKPSRPSRFLSELKILANKPKICEQYRPAQNTIPIRQTAYKPIVAKEIDVSQFNIGTRVRHAKFGEGTILSVSGTETNPYAEIEFNEPSMKLVLSLAHAPLEVI
ncbi:MAG: UvrD-helicase domain-containing protein [Firmicutes bacterium]|nr:UvrD-helicase domain-containing protein [Bacillota bacterium]MCL2255972.1 UvrD-helicase domain-containing protein [Bacillota bacterium]